MALALIGACILLWRRSTQKIVRIAGSRLLNKTKKRRSYKNVFNSFFK